MEKKIIDLIKMGFELDKFYAIHFWSHGSNYTQIQGHLKDNEISEYVKLGFEFKFENGMYTASKNNITIVLTK